MSKNYKDHQQPGWFLRSGTYAADIPYEMSRWEKFLLEEQLDESNLENNPKVLDFIVKYARQYFVPTKVLDMYGMNFEE